MKKLVPGLMLAAAVTAGSVSADKEVVAKKTIAIDSALLMQKSKEGQALMASLEKEQEKAVNTLKSLEKEYKEASERLEKQKSLLSKDALLEKSRDLAQKERAMARKRDELAEDLKSSFEVKQQALYVKHMKSAKKVFDDKKGGVLIDVRSPGVLAVAEDLNITDDVLKVVDLDFDAEKKAEKKKSA